MICRITYGKNLKKIAGSESTLQISSSKGTSISQRSVHWPRTYWHNPLIASKQKTRPKTPSFYSWLLSYLSSNDQPLNLFYASNTLYSVVSASPRIVHLTRNYLTFTDRQNDICAFYTFRCDFTMIHLNPTCNKVAAPRTCDCILLISLSISNVIYTLVRKRILRRLVLPTGIIRHAMVLLLLSTFQKLELKRYYNESDDEFIPRLILRRFETRTEYNWTQLDVLKISLNDLPV